MAADRVQMLMDQAESLESIRVTQEEFWEELTWICFPRASSVYQSRVKTVVGDKPDRRRLAENFDGTAMRACNVLATGQAARITPMGARWFALRPPARLQGNQTAENWYARCSEILASALGSSNFYAKAYECYQNRGAYGISALEVTAGENQKGLHFNSLPIGSFAIADNARGEVDTIFQTYHKSPAQVVEMFGDAAPAAVRKRFEDGTTRHRITERILHAIYPRKDRDPRRADPLNKQIASCYIHLDSRTLLHESGYDSVPIAVSRWQTVPLSPYGRGPADYALVEARQANHLEQMLDVQAETAAFPRILYPAGMKDEIDFSPMGLTSFDPAAGENAKPQEWLTAGRYDVGKDRSADKRAAIEAAFFVELFTAIARLSPTATATQVSAIINESRELFHPIYSSMVREFHTPVLRRCFSLLLRQGQMPPPPPAVIETNEIGPFLDDPEVEYVTAMAMAIEQSQIGGLNDILAVMAPLAQADPSVFQVFNLEAMLQHMVRAKGLPTTFLRSPEELAAIRQQQAQAQQAQMAMAATEGVRNLGGVDATQRAMQALAQ